MTERSSHFAASDPAATVLIDLSASGVAKAFGLRPGAREIVTVGSDLRTDLPVAGQGVAPLQFHLVRRAREIWLIPAESVGQIYLNGAPIASPVRLQTLCVVEFGDVRVEARILDAGQCHGTETERFAPYAEASAAQQTERMAPYRNLLEPRAPSAPARRGTPSTFTAHGTEIMAPVRHAPPATLGSLRQTHFDQAPNGSAVPTVESPIAARVPTKAHGVEELKPATNRHAAPVSVHSATPRRTESSFPKAVVERTRAAARPASWLPAIGVLAKSRPLVAVGGGAIASLILAGTLLAVKRPPAHRVPDLPEAPHAIGKLVVTSQLAAVTTATTTVEPVQVVAIATKTIAVGGQRAAVPLSAKRQGPNDPELAAAVDAVIAGRYRDAGAAYVALSQRIDGATTYATIARLLARLAGPECSDNGRVAPLTSCPRVHR